MAQTVNVILWSCRSKHCLWLVLYTDSLIQYDTFNRYSVYVSRYFLHYCHTDLKPTEICDVERSFHAVILWYKYHIFRPSNRSLTWMMPLFHTHHKVCVIRTLITTKRLCYWANGFLHVVSRGNLLTISHLRKRAKASSSK